jgi:hypothetical protein
MVAFVWAYKAGIYLDKILPIKIKKAWAQRQKSIQVWVDLSRKGLVFK